MTIGKNRRDSLLRKGKHMLRNKNQDKPRVASRQLFLESLEDRRLLAVGPQLIGIQPNDGELLPFDNPDYIRTTAPRELLFRFDENQVFDPENLDGIQITRSSLDGDFTPASAETDFNSGDAVRVKFSATKLGVAENDIKLVFSKRDLGGPGTPSIGVIGKRIDISLNINVGNESSAGDLITALSQHGAARALIQAEIVLGDENVDIASPSNSYSPLLTSGANDVVVTPGHLDVTDSPNNIIVRFAETLPDDLYRIDVYGDGLNALRNDQNVAFGDLTDDGVDNGVAQSIQFELDLGAQIISVVPQPVVRKDDLSLTQNKDQILLYFNDDDLDPVSASNVNFYQLIRTNNTTESIDDAGFVSIPTTAEYNSATDSVLLTFADDLDQLPGNGAFRLRVGTNEALPGPVTLITGVDSPTNDFITAQPINATDLESGGVLISGVITETVNFPIDLPGDSTDPGHREINISGETHVGDGSADTDPNIATIEYTFQDDLGFIAGDQGNQPAYNNITDVQKDRARDILEQLSNRAGVQFIETENTGFIIATGDLAVVGLQSGPGDPLGVNATIFVNGEFRPIAIMDDAEDWSDEFGGSWYQTAMHEIGHQLGLLHAYDLPAHTVMGQGAVGPQYGPALLENDFPGEHDEVHLNHLLRPESRDIDLYEFTLTNSGLFTAETIAERLRDFNTNNHVLNSALTLFKLNADGTHSLLAQNDDYYSDDSFLELNLDAGTYFVGVSASGNTSYDPVIEDSGFNGKSEGDYKLKINFSTAVDPASGNVLVDADNPIDGNRPEIHPTALDGDFDGVSGGVFNFWFRAAAETTGITSGLDRTIFVDKSAPNGGIGTLASPFNNVLSALNINSAGAPLLTPNQASVEQGDILRIVSNAGMDGDIRTELDNLAYEFGFDELGSSLDDGVALEIPKGVLVQVDAGAIMKMRRSWIGIGSSSSVADRDSSGSAFQVFGAPNFVDTLGNLVPNNGDPFVDALPLTDLTGEQNENAVVHITSYQDETLGLDTFTFPTTPDPGDWGGILINHAIDAADQSRFDFAKEGIFLNNVNHADIRYGGGQVVIDSVVQTIGPVEIVDARPTIGFNEISFSRDAAIAASPNSFKESNFHSPEYQEEFNTSPFTVDYKRVGPEIYRNVVHDNTTNGLAIRISTLSGSETQKLTVPGRFDDQDITHVLQENLVIASTPGGPFLETVSQSLELVTLNPINLGASGSLPNGDFAYKLVFVDLNGNESLATDVSRTVTLTGTQNGVDLRQLLTGSGDFVARRLYRQNNGVGPFVLIATINQTDTMFVDDGTTLFGDLDDTVVGKLRPRFDARLAIDSAIIVKLDGAHIQTELGAQLIAEGNDGHEIVFTSILDDRYGAGGVFDASNDGLPVPGGVNVPAPGLWGGFYMGPESTLSLDNVVIAYGGGITAVEGTFTAFNAVEIHQGQARIANSVFEFNAGGFGGQAPDSRFGRGENEEAAIFVSDSQPIIIDNVFRNNTDADETTRISAISINANSLSHELQYDYGRSTGTVDSLGGYRDNHGPLVVGNRLTENEINGMVVRGEVLTTQGIWDDTDIVNVLFDEIVVPDFHTYGGLRLQSNPGQSLIIKLGDANAGFDVTGRQLEIDDRIGGTIQILGQPKSPVVITSLNDDSVGAGIQPNGDPLVDTNNDGPLTTAQPGDWNTILIDQFAHDRNVGVVVENESRDVNVPGPNATARKSQYLGELAPSQKSGDDNRRLGFEVTGFLANPLDIDVYSFEADAGTEIFVDIDRTTHSFDAVLELVDSNDRVLVRSTSSLDETNQDASLAIDASMENRARVLHKADSPFSGKDYWAINPRDPGMRVVLPGPTGVRSTYALRIRSNTPEGQINDLTAGLSSGAYAMQVRLNELDEVAGSMIQYALINYASTGITVVGQPIHSFLSGETREIEVEHLQNDSIGTAENIGNLLQSDRGTISVSGYMHENLTPLTSPTRDLDWDEDYYRFEVAAQEIQSDDVLNWPVVIDLDWADGLGRANLNLGIYDEDGNLIYWSSDSNVADDRPRPAVDNQVEDLSRGSVGTNDPFIGPISLLPGVYFAAVSLEGHEPAIGTTTKFEPVDSVRRVVEDHIDDRNLFGTLDSPELIDLWDEQSVIPWVLGDVNLYVTYANEMAMFDPFTGAEEVDFNGVDYGTSSQVADIGRQFDGTVHSFSHAHLPLNFCNPQDANNMYLELNTGNGTASPVGATGIQTFELDPADPTSYKRAHNCDNSDVGYGVDFEAMYFGNQFLNDISSERLLAVGNRNDTAQQRNGVEWKTNLVYELDPETGIVRHTGDKFDQNPTENEASTNAWAVGRIVTGPELSSLSGTNPLGRATSTRFGDGATVSELNDGDTFIINDGFQDTTFELDFGPEIKQDIDVLNAQTMKDGFFWVLDPDTGIDDNESVFQFDTGNVIDFFADGIVLNDGTIVTINDGNATQSFEFDKSVPADLTDPSAIRIAYGAGTPAIQLAGLLRNVITGNNQTTVTATTVGSRVTLENDVAVSITNVIDTVEGVRIEGNVGGAPIVHIKDPSLLVDGDIFSVFNNLTLAQTVFEFEDLAVGNGVGAGIGGPHIQVDFNTTDTPEQVAAQIDIVISGTTLDTGWHSHLGGDRVVVNGPQIEIGASTANSLAATLQFPTGVIDVEEPFDRDLIGEAVQAEVSAFPGFDVGFYEDRINFLGAEIGDFRGVAPRWIDLVTEGGVSDPQHVGIQLLAHDEGADFVSPFILPPLPPTILDGIATKLANAINANYANQQVVASAVGGTLSIEGGQVILPPGSPLSGGGAGPGGLITGLTATKTITGRTDQLFAVSDQGGLYEIDVNIRQKETLNVNQTFVTSSAADLNGINFTGLTVGPQNVENGRYADMLFGLDSSGVVYAFDTNGELQPIFVDGATSIQLDLNPFAGAPVGLVFGNLDTNLFWNQIANDDSATQQNEDSRFNTQFRLNPTDVICEADDSWDRVHVALVPCPNPNSPDQLEIDKRQFDAGHGIPPAPDGTRIENVQGVESLHFGRGNINNDPRSYDFIGGAHGSMVSNEFSLEGKSSADNPILYFNYFKDAGDGDSARVFISDNGGEWSLLSSLANTNGVWDQARIGLNAFAGAEHLRLRIDFYTSGDSDTGTTDTAGSELRTIEGQYLRDGESFTIDGQIFEFESGITFVAPSGSSIVDNSTLELTDENDVITTFEFLRDPATVTAGNTAVLISDLDSGADVAIRLQAEANAAGYAVHLNQERLNFPVDRLGNGPSVINASPDVLPFIEGQIGLNVDGFGVPLNPNAVTIFVHEGMDRVEVADEVNISIEPAFYSPVIIADAGNEFSDGEVFVLSDSVLNPVTNLASARTYEFDTGFLIDIPVNGGQGVGDGETITFTDNATGNTFTVEFDNDDIDDGVAVGNVEVSYQNTDLMLSLGTKLVNAINGTGQLGLNADVIDSNRIQVHSTLDTVVATSATFGIDANSVPGVGIDIEIQATGADLFVGQLITLTTPGNPADTTVTFEIDFGGGVGGGNVPVLINALDDQATIAATLGAAITGEGFQDVTVIEHFVGMSNNDGVIVNTGGIVGITARDHESIQVIPGSTMVPSDVAIAVRDAINATAGLDITAAIGDAQRRIALTHTSLIPTAIVFVDNTGGLTLELPVGDVDNNIVKQHEDLLRIVGHTVDDAGPFGLADILPGDPQNPVTRPARQPSRLQDNDHEGFYVDDFIIGYAERGEMVTVFNGNSIYDGPPVGVTEGEYQLEIRRSSEYLTGGLFNQTFDTNDRQTNAFRVVASDGADIADGQIFTLTDGMNVVNFEYNDQVNDDGVTPGNLAIPFTSEQLAWEIAISLRDSINRSEVRAALDVTAALSDGTDGVRFADDNDDDPRDDLRFDTEVFGGSATLSSSIVDLHGDAYILGAVGPRIFDPSFGPAAEPNDIISQAVDTGINGSQSLTFQATGSIGDNQDLGSVPARDADLFKLSLNAGNQVDIRLESVVGGLLDPVLTIYDSLGAEIVSERVDATANGGLEISTFVAPTSSTFFIGVSGFPDSETKPLGAGVVLVDTDDGVGTLESNNTGFYKIEITTGAVAIGGGQIFELGENADGTLNEFSTLRGDSNLLREQGQILLHGNRISNSLDFGIHIEAGARDAVDGNAPHQGAVRHLDEINDAGLVPGVTVTNNLITHNGTGGIRFSGDANGAGLPTGAVPFGRIINNTIVGVGGDLIGGLGGADVGIQVDQNASPTLLNNIIVNTALGINVDDSSNTTVVGGTLYQGNLQPTNYSGEDFAISLSNADALFVDPSINVNNFYLKPGTPANPNRAIDSSISSLGERFVYGQVKSPVGISPSPIIAPVRDVTGQLRVDDPTVEPPNGLGTNVFIDRGAIDRSDFTGPVAVLINPKDNDADGVDQNNGLTVVNLSSDQVVSSFEIRLNDGQEPADPSDGIGIADNSVTTEKVIVRRNGALLKDGIDYSFSYNETNDTIRLTPLSGIWTPDRIYTIDLANLDYWKLDAEAGININDGDTFLVRDLNGTNADFEFERGYSLQVPPTLQIQIPVEAGGLGGIVDGEFFSIKQGNIAPIQFEFDRDIPSSVIPGRVAVPFTVNSTVDEIGDAMVTAIESTFLGVHPVNLGDGQVHLGTNETHVLDISLAPSLTQSGVAGGVKDSGFFTIDDGTKLVTFEFEDGDIGDGLLTADLANGDVQIDFTTEDTHEVLATKISTAINSAGLNLNTQALTDGLLHVGGSLNHQVVTIDSELTQQGTPGVRPEFGIKVPTVAGAVSGILDAEKFVIQFGATNPVTFELNNTDVDPDITLGNTRIDFTDATTLTQFMNEIIIAIKGAGLELDPVRVPGTALISLGTSSTHSLNVNQTGLVKVGGNPGDPTAIGVSVLPMDYFDSTQTAVQIIQAITQQTQLSGVVAIPNRGNEIIVTGAATVSTNKTNIFLVDEWDVQTPRFVREIEDLATNPLKPNHLSGETFYAIQIGVADYDTGDAPDGIGTPPQNAYPTISGHNPAIHMSGSDVFLGERVDRDADGQPTVTDDLDGEDYLVDTTFAPGLAFDAASTSGNIIVTSVQDSDTFSISDTANTYTFEFEDTSVADGFTLGNFVVNFDPADNANTIATAITQTIIDADLDLNLNPIVRAGGQVELTGDDADGVTGVGGGTIGFFNPFVSTSLEINANTDGLLDAWIDFNSDGDWDDASEQVAFSLQLSAGLNAFNVQAPFEPESVSGETYARFRFSDVGGLRATGLTVNGEVEDYVVQIVDGRPPEPINDPIGGTAGFATTEDADLPALPTNPSLLTNDTDVDGNDIRVNTFDATSALGAAVTVDTNWKSVGASSGTFIYDPRAVGIATQELSAGEIGLDTFTYTLIEENDPATNAFGFTSQTSGIVTITLTGVNDAPTVSDTSIAAFEDGVTVDGSFVGDDVDHDDDGSTINYSIVADLGVGEGSVVNNTDGTFTFDPGSDFQDLADGETRDVFFTYKATDSQADDSAVDATVTVTVTGVNDSPIAGDDLRTVAQNIVTTEGGLPAAGVLLNDIDVDASDVLRVTKLGAENLVAGTFTTVTNRGASLTLNDDGSFTYDPTNSAELIALDVGDSVDDGVQYTMTDPHGQTSTATLTFTVNGVNDAPLALDDSYAIGQDEVLSVAAIGLMGNDSDPDGDDGISVTDFGTPFIGNLSGTSTLGATVVLNSTGAFSYDPSTSVALQELTRTDSPLDDTFSYEITDNNGGTATAVVTVTVSGTNKAPVANPDVFATTEQVALPVDQARDLLANDTEPESDPMTVTGVNGSTNMTGTSNLGADVEVFANGTFSYDPIAAAAIQALADGATDVDTFSYVVEDDMGGVANGTVTINLTGINDAPVAVDDTLNVDPVTLAPLAPRNTTISIDILGNDFDIDGTIDAVEIVTSPAASEAVITLETNNTVTFVPATDFSGNVTFTYRIQDDLGEWSVPATVSVEVNDAPVAVDDGSSSSPIEVYQDFANNSTAIDVLANDTDADGTLDPASVQVTVAPLHGTIVGVLADGSVEYRPDVGYLGADDFAYTVADDDGAVSNEAMVNIGIVNDPFPWHNRGNGLDVNADGSVSPIDALLIIIELDANGSTVLPPLSAGNSPPPYLDVNEDGIVAPNDVIQVINFLNANANGEAPEGEFSNSVDTTRSTIDSPEVRVPASDVSAYRFTDMRNMRSSGLSTVRGEVLEDLLGEIAEDLMDAREDELLVDIALDDFFG